MRDRCLCHRQRGAALLIMMLVVLAAATAILLNRVNLNQLRISNLGVSQAALAEARDALINYALVMPELQPGAASMLPCPDLDDSGGFAEGIGHTAACGAAGVTVMGRVPWQTLGIEPSRDSSAACLWYVVSGSYKDAGASTATLINADSNGQLQLTDIDSGVVIVGAQPDERAVAFVLAPMPAIDSQDRPAVAGRQCSNSFDASRFLDVDAGTGISNSVVAGSADVVDNFAVSTGYNASHNDRVAVITRSDLARKVLGRPDFEARVRALGLAAAGCIADYAAKNSGAPNDKRMPWPAPLTLADYRPDSNYDDSSSVNLSGRLPDVVDDSSAAIGNPVTAMFSDCDPVAVAAWTPAMQGLWRHWKDHFFYAVAESFAPAASVPSACGNCLSVNGGGSYAAVLLFASSRLGALSQLRNAPPLDVDTRGTVSNYLEDANAANMPYSGGSIDFVSQAATATFNDLLFCIDASLIVTEC